MGTTVAALALWWLRPNDDGVFLYAPFDVSKRQFIASAWRGDSLLLKDPRELATEFRLSPEMSISIPVGRSRGVQTLMLPDVTFVPISRWTKSSIGPLQLPTLVSRIRYAWSVLQFRMRWSRGPLTIDEELVGKKAVSLDFAVQRNYVSQFLPGTNCTVFYAPGLDSTVLIYPLVISNQNRIQPFRATLLRLLSSNGLQLAKIGPGKLKIYPTAQAMKYANAPVE